MSDDSESLDFPNPTYYTFVIILNNLEYHSWISIVIDKIMCKQMQII